MRLKPEYKVAIFAIVTLLSLYFVINYLKGKELFSGNNSYYTYCDDIEGLVPTTPIYIRGLKIGSIARTEYDSKNDRFLLTLSVKKGYKIPKDSKVLAYDTDLLGSRAIKVDMGSSPTVLNSKDTIESGAEKGMIESVVESLIPITVQLSTVIQSIDTLLISLNSLLDDQTRERVSSSLAHLESTLKSGNQFIDTLLHLSPSLQSSLKNIEGLTANLDKGSGSLNNTLENLSQITDSLTTADLSGAINSLKSIIERAENPEGTIGKILHKDELHESTLSLIKEIESLIAKIKENPKKYIKISVF